MFVFLETGTFMLMTLGLLGLASGCLVLLFQPYELLFKLKVVFSEGGEIFELWRNPPVELYLKVYLWNVTNHDDYISGKADKLVFQEVGPYVYRLVDYFNQPFYLNTVIKVLFIYPIFRAKNFTR